MSDRRRANRFVVPEASEGAIRIMQDVYVEQISQGLFAVVGDTPLAGGGDLLLELPRGIGERVVMNVEVIDSHTVMVGGESRHRTVLRAVQLMPRRDAALRRGTLPS
jgi:hypothetical protein